MVKDHSDSERGNPLLPHRLLFPISSKGSFICAIPDRIAHWAISRSSQCTTTGVTGCGMCYPVCGMMHIKESMLLICGQERTPSRFIVNGNFTAQHYINIILGAIVLPFLQQQPRGVIYHTARIVQSDLLLTLTDFPRVLYVLSMELNVWFLNSTHLGQLLHYY